MIQAGTSSGASDLASVNVGLATTVSGVAPLGTQLFVRAVALNAAGAASSNEISFTVPQPSAPVLQAAVVAGARVTLTWTGPAGATYTLRVRPTPTGALIASVPVGTVTSVSVPGVTNGTYHVTVFAEVGGSTTGESNQIVVVVP